MTQQKTTIDKSRELRFENVNGSICETVKNIVGHKGISQNAFLLQVLTSTANSYPEKMKQSRKPCVPCKEIRVRGIGKKLKEEIENIAANTGVSPTSLLEIEVTKVVETYPEYMKTPMPKHE